jgi:hypothetical protein
MNFPDPIIQVASVTKTKKVGVNNTPAIRSCRFNFEIARAFDATVTEPRPMSE